jgi:hypothetical protein
MTFKQADMPLLRRRVIEDILFAGNTAGMGPEEVDLSVTE